MEKQICGAVIVGGGSSRRMDGVSKVFVDILGRPAIEWTLAVFQRSEHVHQVVLVLPKNDIDRANHIVSQDHFTKVSSICEGGERRQDSAFNGLLRIKGCDIVMIHDAARPCITEGIIERGVNAVQKTGATVAAVRVVDTLGRGDEHNNLVDNVPRENLWSIQTPQVFSYPLIMAAHQLVKTNVTDDASMIKIYGGEVVIFEGSYKNIKLTTPDQLELVEMFI